MLLSPNRGTNHNVHVHGNERDAAAGQPPNPQHRRKHHVPGNGCGAGQRELGAERDSQHAATEPQGAL